VGRFAPEKDFPLLVRAVAPLLRGGDLRLLIVGDGAEMGRVRAEVEALGVDGLVSLPGARSDIPECLAAMDVFVLSSRMEGTPIAVLEAMAAGLPLVASAVGGLPALVTDGENGFLFPSGDETALRARVRALRDDPSRAARVAEAGRRLVEAKYSREAMARKYLDLYARRGVHP
jgi:glycosyltransferase involved in cell wall biosynthesis